MSFLPEKIESFDYYKEKLPLYLQNSYGFLEHFRIWYELLKSDKPETSVVNVGNLILYLMNIFDKDFLETIAGLEGSGAGEGDYGDTSDILDKLGDLFGVSRTFTCTYVDEHSQTVTEQLNLNNENFLILIKCQIIKNYCEGTYKQISDYYRAAGLNVFMFTYATDPATCYLYLVEILESDNYSEDVRTMFLAGMLRIESMGITYVNILTNPTVTGFLVWDTNESDKYWDEGAWAI